MQMTIAGVLTPDELSSIRAAFDAASFVDGRETAGWAAKSVKNNIQAKAGDPAMDAARALVREQLLADPLFAMAARPKQISSLLFARYEPGMQYGAHVDDALMGGMRSDISFTLFIDEPDTYEGGELVMETSAGETRDQSARRGGVRLSVHHAAPRRPAAFRRAARLCRLGAEFCAQRRAAGNIVRPRHRAAGAVQGVGQNGGV